MIITKEMFYLSRDFRLNNKLSNKIKKDLETLIDSAYEKFDKKEVNKILISRIDELLSTEERERIIFALSYLKFLAIESIN
ncbi:MAG: hypothetical protein LBF15_04635 [Candidatus Peribacteria bacterium]|nr:hypothetical protein [Candidatus Peribacteria bacterium]